MQLISAILYDTCYVHGGSNSWEKPVLVVGAERVVALKKTVLTPGTKFPAYKTADVFGEPI